MLFLHAFKCTSSEPKQHPCVLVDAILLTKYCVGNLCKTTVWHATLSLSVWCWSYIWTYWSHIIPLAVKRYREVESFGSFLRGSSLRLSLCLYHSLHLFTLPVSPRVTSKLQEVRARVAGEFSTDSLLAQIFSRILATMTVVSRNSPLTSLITYHTPYILLHTPQDLCYISRHYHLQSKGLSEKNRPATLMVAHAPCAH